MSIPSDKNLERLLDFTAIKHKVISQNIANAETTGYKRREVEFKELLNNNLSALNKKEQKTEVQIKIDEQSPNVYGTNNVDVNIEMADLAENSILFKFAAKKINGYFQTLQNVIRGGNR